MLAYFAVAALCLGLLIATLADLSAEALSATEGNLTLFSIVIIFLAVGDLCGVEVYDAFIKGVKEGVSFTLMLLIAMLVAVGVLRASGILDAGLSGVRWLVEGFRWVARLWEHCLPRLSNRFTATARGQ